MSPETAVRIDRTVGRAIYRLHTWLYRITGGAIGHSTRVGPMLLLTTTGRRSGRSHTVPLLYMPDGDRFVVVGSNGGRPKPPAWLLNLRARPEAVVQVGRRRLRAGAEIHDDTRSALWSRLTSFYAGWAHYQTLTNRVIPVVVLSPRPGSVCTTCGRDCERSWQPVVDQPTFICDGCLDLANDVHALDEDADRDRRLIETANDVCSFCRRRSPDVGGLLACRPPAFICWHCVDAANAARSAE